MIRRTTLWTLAGAVLALAVLSALLAPRLLNPEVVRSGVTAFLRARAGLEAVVEGPASVRLLPWPTLELRGVRLGPDAGDPDEALEAAVRERRETFLLTVEAVSLSPRLASLWRGRLGLDGLKAEGVRLRASARGPAEGGRSAGARDEARPADAGTADRERPESAAKRTDAPTAGDSGEDSRPAFGSTGDPLAGLAVLSGADVRLERASVVHVRLGASPDEDRRLSVSDLAVRAAPRQDAFFDVQAAGLLVLSDLAPGAVRLDARGRAFLPEGGGRLAEVGLDGLRLTLEKADAAAPRLEAVLDLAPGSGLLRARDLRLTPAVGSEIAGRLELSLPDRAEPGWLRFDLAADDLDLTPLAAAPWARLLGPCAALAGEAATPGRDRRPFGLDGRARATRLRGFGLEARQAVLTLNSAPDGYVLRHEALLPGAHALVRARLAQTDRFALEATLEAAPGGFREAADAGGPAAGAPGAAGASPGPAGALKGASGASPGPAGVLPGASARLTLRRDETGGLAGEARIEPFSPRWLLDALGRPTAAAPERASLTAELVGDDRTLTARSLRLAVDETTVGGSLTKPWRGGPLVVDLGLDRLDLDRYRPRGVAATGRERLGRSKPPGRAETGQRPEQAPGPAADSSPGRASDQSAGRASGKGADQASGRASEQGDERGSDREAEPGPTQARGKTGSTATGAPWAWLDVQARLRADWLRLAGSDLRRLDGEVRLSRGWLAGASLAAEAGGGSVKARLIAEPGREASLDVNMVGAELGEVSRCLTGAPLVRGRGDGRLVLETADPIDRAGGVAWIGPAGLGGWPAPLRLRGRLAASSTKGEWGPGATASVKPTRNEGGPVAEASEAFASVRPAQATGQAFRPPASTARAGGPAATRPPSRAAGAVAAASAGNKGAAGSGVSASAAASPEPGGGRDSWRQGRYETAELLLEIRPKTDASGGKFPRDHEIQGSVRAALAAQGRLRASNVRAKLTIANGVLAASPVEASFHGGSLSGAARVGLEPSPPLTVEARLRDFQSGELIRDLFGLDYLGGAARADVSLTARAGADALSSLSGRVRIGAANGYLRLNRLLGGTGRRRSGGQAETLTRFDTASAVIDVESGVASNRDLRVEGPLYAVTGEGSADLVGRELDYVLRFAMTGLPTVPVRVHGPLASPGYDAQASDMALDSLARLGQAIIDLPGQVLDLPRRTLDALRGLFGD